MSTPKDDAAGDKPDGGATGKPDEGAGGKLDEGGGSGEASKTFTQADLEAAEARGRRAAEDAAKKRAKDEKLSEEERFKQRAEEAESKLRERDARDSFERAAREAGATNPLKVYRLYKDELEFDDSGKPTNLKELVTRAKREYGDEFGAKRPGGSADGAAGGGGSGAKPTMNDIIRGRGRK